MPPTITIENVTWFDLDRRVTELQWEGWEVAAESTQIDGITAGFMAGKLDQGSMFTAYHFLNVIPEEPA